MKQSTTILMMALVLALASCGGDDGAPGDSETSTTTSTADPATTTEASSTTAATGAPSSTAAPAATEAPFPTLPPPPALGDGRPETFVAVTTDYEAVEVDTATGAVLTSFGQAASAAELGGEFSPNVVDSIWRTADGEFTILSECCEPAGGQIWYLRAGEQLNNEAPRPGISSDGWLVAPSPTSSDIAVLGYTLSVGSVGALATVWEDLDAGTFAVSQPTWSRDGRTVSWLGGSSLNPGAQLYSIDLASGAVTANPLPWLDDREIDGIATQASGNLVAFVFEALDRADPGTGVVFTPSGELFAEFVIEPGSRLGGYDATGTFLIYIDGTGAVRWQGGGGSGVLAEGFVHASW